MVPQIKQDPDAASPYIKPDPDSKDAVLADIDDQDLYEDAGDLDFSNASQSVWLSRIPRTLWEHWSNLDDDEEIQIGTVRIEGPLNDIKRKVLQSLKPKRETVFIDKVPGKLLQARHVLPGEKGAFVITTICSLKMSHKDYWIYVA
ncbi:unnamed protein product [Aspergillus oryzae RIB40]|uniref:DNA, SC005 n=1 Tax=Aspergillus oryzae (strain ATCC 42149 / RIB 40) TaxID=510516 RepID=Q2US26_ASPOR|nr:unnamed protein product [Aspergillus oryzae RIB40]BAE55639.1 unnamed protein product [Aspergillus oryzae RIB40]